jgi:hypothetical protein
VVVRTPLGRAILADAREESLEEITHEDHPKFVTEAMGDIRKWSAKKKKAARETRRQLGKSVTFSEEEVASCPQR